MLSTESGSANYVAVESVSVDSEAFSSAKATPAEAPKREGDKRSTRRALRVIPGLKDLGFSDRGLNRPGKTAAAREHHIRYDNLKRYLDILGSLALIVATIPFFLVVPLAMKLSSKGPIIFKQRRLTQGERVFTMYKFRTMSVDAESGTGAVWAKDGDPRVTNLGRFMRRTRIDELPQLFNVLVGDMSLIGPRPERPEFAEELSRQLPNFPRRHAVKAGITGLAQVGNGYAACIKTYRRKLALDLIYVHNRSLLLDTKIALKTVLVILTGSGAR
jgi:lipopolysaccharide/colanic/teichoic acid biosynthesis glycosyltransferase